MDITLIMENQMGNQTDNDMEAIIYRVTLGILMVASQIRGPQHRPQNTMMLILRTPQKATPNFGKRAGWPVASLEL